MAPILSNLELALRGLLRQLEPLPPFSAERAALHGEAEILRAMIRRLRAA